ncbi:MAG: glycerophosphodiester phosphodiesterase family protein [Hyphomicrobiaceae bacterium]
MLDRDVFCRPIAHRGLHRVEDGVIENSVAAFEAALPLGYGIECDLQPANDGTPMVFHDHALGRLVEAKGATSDYSPAALRKLVYRAAHGRQHILSLGEMLDLVGGKVPLLIEVKTDWSAPNADFVSAIADVLGRYRGPAAVMSFDPAYVAALKPVLPDTPRGVVAGVYRKGWLPEPFDEDLAWRLSNLLTSRGAEPHFIAYCVDDLPTPVMRFWREGLGMPLFAWTVRTPEAMANARLWADAPIFEAVDPKA